MATRHRGSATTEAHPLAAHRIATCKRWLRQPIAMDACLHRFFFRLRADKKVDLQMDKTLTGRAAGARRRRGGGARLRVQGHTTPPKIASSRQQSRVKLPSPVQSGQPTAFLSTLESLPRLQHSSIRPCIVVLVPPSANNKFCIQPAFLSSRVSGSAFSCNLRLACRATPDRDVDFLFLFLTKSLQQL